MLNLKRVEEIKAQLRKDPKFMAQCRARAEQKFQASKSPNRRCMDAEVQILLDAPAYFFTNCDADGEPTAKSRVIPDFRDADTRLRARAARVVREFLQENPLED